LVRLVRRADLSRVLLTVAGRREELLDLLALLERRIAAQRPVGTPLEPSLYIRRSWLMNVPVGAVARVASEVVHVIARMMSRRP
jgi:hypothetical protein